MIKICPFSMQLCVGQDCVNFEWRLFEVEEKARGSCIFFDRWTGHEVAYQKPVLAPVAMDG
jgi:hypothetical protein